jgi:hypothetical protein
VNSRRIEFDITKDMVRCAVDHFVADGVPIKVMRGIAQHRLHGFMHERNFILMVDGLVVVIAGVMSVLCTVWASDVDHIEPWQFGLWAVCALMNAWTVATTVVDGTMRLRKLMGGIACERMVLAYLTEKEAVHHG